MADNNKHNILYFEGSSMRVLHNTMDEWQKENEKRFLSMSVNKDGETYCCIALTNPSEVTITNPTLDVNIVDSNWNEMGALPVEVKYWDAGTLDVSTD
jgi:hypothetical protein